MKVKITYWEGGSTWSEVIRANNVLDAKKIGEARNPSIKIIGANPHFYP
jgi:hypothetical protein